MKKMHIIMMFVAMIIVTISVSCGTSKKAQKEKIEGVQFTTKIVNDYKLTPEKKGSLQFFNGPSIDNEQGLDTLSIILKRTYFEKYDTIINGKLKPTEIERISIVRIPPATKGVMVSYLQDKMLISFDESDSLSLVFAPNNGNYVLLCSKNNQVNYGGNVYNVISGAGGTAKLFFDFELFKKTIGDEKTSKGRTVSSSTFSH